MPLQPSFEVFDYAGYLLRRWRFLLACCAVAGSIAATISFFLPKRYTATATVLIDAPAGNDPRASTAVSPVYLESLKTYERLAESDTLFQSAIQKFDLRASEGPVAADRLKARVLKVTKPRDTKMLQIQVTLRDPVKARDVARFIAESTAEKNRSMAQETDDDMRREARENVESARRRVDQADRAMAEEARQPTPDSLQTELEASLELKSRIRRQMLDTETELASLGSGGEARRYGPDPAELRARRDVLRKQFDGLTAESEQRSRQLGQRQASLARLEADRKSARAVYDAAAARLNDTMASTGSRGERLRVADPGTVPERSSSPNTVLNVLGALLIAMVAGLLYVSIEFAHGRHKAARDFSGVYRSMR